MFMKKSFPIFLILISCNNSTDMNSSVVEDKVFNEFSPSSTIESEYDKLSEGDKKSYKLRGYWIQNILKDVIEMTEDEKKISYNEVINNNLRVMDLTAISLAKESNIPILVTNIFKRNCLISALNQTGKYSKIS